MGPKAHLALAWTDHPPIVGSLVCARATSDLTAPPGPTTPRAAPKRMREFASGRRCAAQALLDAGSSDLEVGVGSGREPIWPVGFVGSITHSASFAWAAVARASDLRSIGIDSEHLLDDAAIEEALPMILDADELALVKGPHVRRLATMAFSAKESLYKCLSPCVGVFFEFFDAQIEWILPDRGESDRGTFSLRLRRALTSEFLIGTKIAGSYAFSGGHAHTAVELRP